MMSDPTGAPAPPPGAGGDAAMPSNTRGVAGVRVHPLVRLFLWGVGLVLLLWFLKPLGFVLLMLLAAGCLAAALKPLRRWMPGPRWLAGSVIGVGLVVVVTGLLALAGWLIATPIREQFQQWPEIRQTLDEQLQQWGQRLGVENLSVATIRDQLLGGLTGSGGGELVGTTMSHLGLVLVALALLFFGAIYLLASPQDATIGSLKRLLPGRERALDQTFDDLQRRLRWWLLGTLVSMVAAGLFQGFGYWVIGLKFALPLGVLAGIFQIVPTFGPAAIYILSLLIAATQGMQYVALATVVYVVAQVLESDVLTPLVMKKAVRIPPLITLFSVILWGQVFGLLGLLMALPLNIVIWTLVERFYLQPAEERAGTPPG